MVALVAFPEIEDGDRLWIESFRAEHDPAGDRIAVHFTLVFPCEALPGLQPEIGLIARSTEQIEFAARRAEVVADTFGNGHHVFLVPDEGADRILALHDRLYAGTLRTHLREDVSFVPHMTIAAAGDRASALKLAGGINERGLTVRGTLRTLKLLDVSGARVESIARFELVPGSGR